MLHLFNKVYLKPDVMHKDTRRRIVLSEKWLTYTYHTKNLLKTLQGTEFTPPEHGGLSYAEMIEREFAGDDTRFIRDLLRDTGERITIYATPHDILVIHAKFLKTLYPHWDVATYRRVSDLYTLMYKSLQGMGYLSFAKIIPPEAAALREEFELYSGDEQFMADLWTNTQPYALLPAEIEKIMASTSVELQLANVVLNPRWRYVSQLSGKLQRMVYKQVVREYISDVRNLILMSLVNFSALEPYSPFDPADHTVHDLVRMYPQYGFLTDPKFAPEHIDHVIQTYDFDSLRAIYYKVLSLSPWNEQAYGELIRKPLTYVDVLKFEASNDKDHKLFRQGDYAESVNPYFIDAIIDAYQSGNMDFLRLLELKVRN